MEQMTERVRQRNNFNAWYYRNAESYNAERQRKYSENSKVRQKARESSAAYRLKVASGKHVPALRNGYYTSAHVARILGISRQTLSNWEAKDMIPKPTQEGKHRLYSKRQVYLLKAYIEAQDDRAALEVARTNMFVEWDEGDE